MSKAQKKSAVRRKRAVSKESEADQQMFEQSPEEKLKDVREAEVKFADWALQRISQGEFRKNYYKLLKQYEEENGRMVKD